MTRWDIASLLPTHTCPRQGYHHPIQDSHTQIWLLGNMQCTNDLLRHLMVVTCIHQQQQEEECILHLITTLTTPYLHPLMDILHTTKCIPVIHTCPRTPLPLWGPVVFIPLTLHCLDQLTVVALFCILLLLDSLTHQ